MDGIVKIEKVVIVCPGCGQTVESVVRDGVVSGWCAVSKQNVRVEVKANVNVSTVT